MGVTYDNITGTHTLTFGSPIPTTNVSGGVSFKNTNTYVFDLKNFPAGILPSGGSSNIASASEMVMCQLREENYVPKGDRTFFEWHKAAGIHSVDTIIYSGYGPEAQEDPSWASYWSYDFSFIGHFSWEINEPGYYYVIIKADGGRGNARIDFQVVDTTPAATISYSSLGFANSSGTRFANCQVSASEIGGYVRTAVDYFVEGGPISSITGIVRYTLPNGTVRSWPVAITTTVLSGTLKFQHPDRYEAGNYSNLSITLQANK